MSRATRNQETSDALSRWWWHGQWLRIVWGVWVDQEWYWRNVRPRLHSREYMWIAFAQGMFGAAFVALSLSVTLGMILTTTGMPVDWSGWIQGLLLFGGGMLIMALLATLNAHTATVSYGIALGVTLGLAGSVVSGAIFGVIKSMASSVATHILTGLVIGAAFGISLSVFSSVASGIRSSVGVSLSAAICAFIFLSISGGIIEGMAGGIACGLGCHLGGHWATRQIPDTEMRKRLANPDKHLSES